MATRQHNLEAWKGATFKQAFRLKNNDQTAVDLTGTTVNFEFGVPGDDTPLFTKAGTVSGNEILIYCTDEETELWKATKYFWVLVTETAGGEVNFPISGVFTVKSVANV